MADNNGNRPSQVFGADVLSQEDRELYEDMRDSLASIITSLEARANGNDQFLEQIIRVAQAIHEMVEVFLATGCALSEENFQQHFVDAGKAFCDSITFLITPRRG